MNSSKIDFFFEEYFTSTLYSMLFASTIMSYAPDSVIGKDTSKP
ncbi:MAG TPA: hypothetical protein VMV24_00870 [Candidatus Dormibacteraeota bacterium]|nr:hypothetical protein [Candidatus Dormibacteraeota bacterium]